MRLLALACAAIILATTGCAPSEAPDITLAATSTPPLQTATASPTATPAATPTPIGPTQLTVDALHAGQWRDYSLVQNSEGFFEAMDAQGNLVPDAKFFEDGTADLHYVLGRQVFEVTVAFPAIAADEAGITMGLWRFQDGTWSLETYPAPKAEGDINDWRKLVILRGHAREQAMIDGIFAARDAAFRPESYDAAQEFKGITITENFKTIENYDVRPRGWVFYNWSRNVSGKNNGTGQYIEYWFKPVVRNSRDEIRPMQVALGTGWFLIDVYGPKGELQSAAVHAPVIAMDPDRSLITLSGLVRVADVGRLAPALSKEQRGSIRIYLSRAPVAKPWMAADLLLLGFCTGVNSEFFEKVRSPELGNGVSEGDEFWTVQSLPGQLSETFLTLTTPD